MWGHLEFACPESNLGPYSCFAFGLNCFGPKGPHLKDCMITFPRNNSLGSKWFKRVLLWFSASVCPHRLKCLEHQAQLSLRLFGAYNGLHIAASMVSKTQPLTFMAMFLACMCLTELQKGQHLHVLLTKELERHATTETILQRGG